MSVSDVGLLQLGLGSSRTGQMGSEVARQLCDDLIKLAGTRDRLGKFKVSIDRRADGISAL